MDLIVVGMNHRTAPVDVRERVFFSDDEVLEVLHRTKNEKTLAEAILTVFNVCSADKPPITMAR